MTPNLHIGRIKYVYKVESNKLKKNVLIGRTFSLTEYWNVLMCDINEKMSVGTTSIKYCAIVVLSVIMRSSPSNGCTMPAVVSPKLKRFMRWVKFSGASSKNELM